MELSQPGDTPFDLRFRLFRVPVRVHPFFWLSAFFLGYDYLRAGFEVLLLWIAVVFVSVLLHELGHVWMGQIFGSRGQILLQGFGGLAIGASSVYGRWKRIAVFLAGPGIQFLLFLMIFGVLLAIDRRPIGFLSEFRMLNDLVRTMENSGRIDGRLPDIADRFQMCISSLAQQPGWPRIAQLAVQMLMAVNLWWAVINLMPVYPLDGGQVSREIFTGVNPQSGARNSLALSVAVAVALAINALSGAMNGPTLPYVPSGGVLFIFLFGFLAFNCFMMLQMENARLRSGYRDPDEEDRLPWERDPDEWKRS